MSDQRTEDARDAVLEALALHPPEGFENGMVTKFVVVAELMDENGKKWIEKLDADDAAAWETEGLLHYALYSMGGGDDE